MAYGVIYKITNKVNGKLYVGQTKQLIEERFKQHIKADTYIGNAIRKHGAENFTIEVIAVCESREELDACEIAKIAEYDCMAPKGYNCTTGGEGGSPCEETVEKLRASANAYYEEHPEARDRISAEQKARFSDPEEIAKAAERTRKSFEDPERVAKHSEGQRRRFERQEERDKIAAAVTKRFSDPAEREAQSARISAYFDKPGTRDRVAETQKKRFEDPAEHEKVSIGLKKYYAEHPEAAKKISERTKGRKDSEETRERKRIGQKARHEREQKERLPLKVAEQNRAAAEWESLPIGLKNFRIEQLSDIEQFISDAKKLKEKLRSRKRRAAKKISKIAEQNKAAAQLPRTINLAKSYVGH